MHEVRYSIRRILPSELPKVAKGIGTGKRVPMRNATTQELLDRGMCHLGDDYYSCVEQFHSDDLTGFTRSSTGALRRVWTPVADPLPGTVVAEGSLHVRHAQLTQAAKSRIMRAHVLRAAKKSKNAKRIVEAHVKKHGTTIARRLGTGAADARAIELAAAHAVVADRKKGVVMATVPMGDVDEARDFVVETHVIPHHWAGEAGSEFLAIR